MAAAMPLNFDLSEQDGILTVRVSGTRPLSDSQTLEEYTEGWSRVADHCRERGIRRVLDVNLARGDRSSAVVLSFFSHLRELGFDRGMRFAVVFGVPDGKRVTELGVAVAAENGWRIRLFETEGEALRWLAEAPDEGDEAASDASAG